MLSLERILNDFDRYRQPKRGPLREAAISPLTIHRMCLRGQLTASRNSQTFGRIIAMVVNGKIRNGSQYDVLRKWNVVAVCQLDAVPPSQVTLLVDRSSMILSREPELRMLVEEN